MLRNEHRQCHHRRNPEYLFLRNYPPRIWQIFQIESVACQITAKINRIVEQKKKSADHYPRTATKAAEIIPQHSQTPAKNTQTTMQNAQTTVHVQNSAFDLSRANGSSKLDSLKVR